MPSDAITPAAVPLAELPAVALKIAAGFAGSTNGLDHISIRPGMAEDQVLVTAASETICCEVNCSGQASCELLLPVAAVKTALRRLPGEHASVVAGDDLMATLRLYSPDATLAMQMLLGAAERGVRLPAVEPAAQIAALALDARLLLRAAQRLSSLGVIDVGTIPRGWLLTGSAEGIGVRALIAGVQC